MQIKNLVGNRYGLLTVVRLAGKSSCKHLLWECVCECGQTSVHTGNNLRCGHAKSCGHLRKGSQRVDLVGQSFGRLTVTSESKTLREVAYWRCQCSCGNTCKVSTGHLRSGHTKSCGCLSSEVSRKLAYENLAGKKKLSPNGSLRPRKVYGGYIKVHDREHPRCDSGGFVLEHVKVMEKRIGRFLIKGETVHHINGVRDDNRDDNLELWSSSHPKGQRVLDKVSWAVDLLKLYSPNLLK